MTRLERNARLYDVLQIMGTAYENGDFSEFVELLTEDCAYTSMWVLETIQGRKAVSRRLLGKGRAIQKSGCFPECWVVELVGNMNPLPEADVIVNGNKTRASVGLAYEAGKPCLMMRQELGDKDNEVLVDLQLTEEGKVSGIDVCMPELFRTNVASEYIFCLPAKGEEKKPEALIRISENYFTELYTFLGMVETQFDEYEDMVIPMETWMQALNFWKTFAEATEYDAFIESAAGIHYENWAIDNKAVLERLNKRGVLLWKRRKENKAMLDGLLEWTQKYKSSCDCICTVGF